MIAGCLFDPSEKESQLYRSDFFSIKIDNVINPPTDDETLPVSIILSKLWSNGPSQIISRQDDFFIDHDEFKITVGIIEQASIKTTGEYVSQSEGNEAIFTFTPIAPLSTETGVIELEVPIWSSQYINGEL